MKKTLISSLCTLCALVMLLSSCRTVTGGDKETTDTKPSVTTARDGFEDVTLPPETTKAEESEPVTEPAETTEAPFTVDDAVAAARAYLGETDIDTGYKYTYSFEEMTRGDNGEELFKVRVSWFIEEQGRSSFLGYLLVSENGSVTKYDW